MYPHPKRCSWWQKQKKTALFTLWGSVKATVTPLVIGKLRLPQKAAFVNRPQGTEKRAARMVNPRYAAGFVR